MNTNSNSYTIIYASVMVVIVEFLLAFVSSSLRSILNPAGHEQPCYRTGAGYLFCTCLLYTSNRLIQNNISKVLIV